jgi:lipid II:glycine glycyltransferase (peptidoglycan interpeptide bridge formation enzyme)
MSLTCVSGIEERRWDAFVRGHPGGHLLQSAAWGRLKSAFGWEALRLAVLEGEEIRAAAQVLFRRFPGFSLAYVPRGPVVDWEDEEALEALLEGLERAGRSRRALFLKIEPNRPEETGFSERLRRWGFLPGRPVQPRSTLVVDLEGPEEEILARMKPKTRYNIRLAGRRGVQVRPAHGPEEVALFYDLLQETARRDAFGIHTRPYYQMAYHLLCEEGKGRLLFAEREGEVLAALMVAAWGREAIYLYGASRSRGQEHMPSYLLQWEAMRWARSQGCTRYDLWGIPDSVLEGDERERRREKNVRDGMWGVYRFKQGFGGRPLRTAGAYDRPGRPFLYRLYRRLLGERGF